MVSMRASQLDIPIHATWSQTGVTVAGGNGRGKGTHQLYHPHGLFVDDDQTIYIADYSNDWIVEWKPGASNGQVVAGGNGYGKGDHQLNGPLDVIVDKETDSLIISDKGNARVVKWPRRDGEKGETLISNVYCTGLTMDQQGSLYVVEKYGHKVDRYRRGDTQGEVVAGYNREGNDLDQLSRPWSIFVDQEHSVYVSDSGNHRVMKFKQGAKKGNVIAGAQEDEDSLPELYSPRGIVVDQLETIYVADELNSRIMRWPKRAKHGSVIIGGNGKGSNSNQLNYPIGLSFDRHGNLYVVDSDNARVQRFDINI
ncbi:unnamed protein product [Rotaria socialis]|uniref:Uncharacterized protein n=2 Tax=Rotaria socialis TaxID=392032 RepID=A0A817XHQ2_9BILA|nr:unnamed protein product [Rotaria socialis]CAF3368399.1 unnamed protein product [Rotaria socialis]CAF4395498.1 unnamed protein product [Rotaria socialis]CAF4503545.1 unnamed protein product [Rotaria socialis]CAF4630719.1 unnamed protein product [Rotaria socialis]